MTYNQVKKRDKIVFDLTECSNNDRRLMSVALELYFNRQLSTNGLINLIKQWRLPIIL